MTRRREHILDDSGLDDAGRLRAVRIVLDVASAEMTHGECDIPWELRDRWPAEVSEAAEALRDRYVPERERSRPYFATGVQDLTDPELRRSFLVFAPYAFDATFWSDEDRVISMSDEGVVSLVALNEVNHARLVDELGSDLLVPHDKWARRRPSALRRAAERLGLRL